MNTVTVGNIEMYDLRGIVTPDRAPRTATRGLAIHHTVTYANPAWSEAQELDHIKAINDYHVSVGYGGFGYNAIAFPSGRLYAVGFGQGMRAHVAHRNHELEGLALVGDYSVAYPPPGIILAAGRWLLAKYRQHGLKATMGHRRWAVPSWPTACPGQWETTIIEQAQRVAVALAGQ